MSLKNRRVLVAIGAALVLVVAIAAIRMVAGGTDSEPERTEGSARFKPIDPPTPPTERRDTVWEQLLGEIGPNGEVPLDTALQAFSIAIAPLPDVRVPSGEIGEVDYPGWAVRELLAERNELTEGQLRSFLEAINPPDREPDDVVAPETVPETTPQAVDIWTGRKWTAGRYFPNRYLALAATTELQRAEVRKFVLSARDTISSRLDRALRVPINLFYMDEAPPKNLEAETLARDSDGWGDGSEPEGPAVACDIRFYPTVFDKDETTRFNIVAHETFHCFQQTLLPTLQEWDESSILGDWVTEGQAAWVGFEIAGGGGTGKWWREYLLSPEVSLFSRTYDAIGFYAHLLRSNVNVWNRIDAMLRAAKPRDAFAAATHGAGDDFFHSWASSYFRNLDYGDAWDTSGAGITPDRPVPGQFEIGEGESMPLATFSYSHSLWRFRSNADVVVFQRMGEVRSRLGGPPDIMRAEGEVFCTSGECSCPSGSAYSGPPLERLPRDLRYAVTALDGNTVVIVGGMSIENLCENGKPENIGGEALAGLCPTIERLVRRHLSGLDARPPEYSDVDKCVAEYAEQVRKGQ